MQALLTIICFCPSVFLEFSELFQFKEPDSKFICQYLIAFGFKNLESFIYKSILTYKIKLFRNHIPCRE